MSLSKYLARDKSTIDQAIPSRDEILSPAIVGANDLLFYLDAGDDETYSATITAVVGAGSEADFASGTRVLFREDTVTGWTSQSYTGTGAIRLKSPANSPAFSNAGGTDPFALVFTNHATGGNIALSSSTLNSNSYALQPDETAAHTHATSLTEDGSSPVYFNPSVPYTAGTGSIKNEQNSSQGFYTLYAGGNAPGVASPHTHSGANSSHTHTGNFTGDAFDLDLDYIDVHIFAKD